ncbi:hypothetical protein ABIB82_006921 [Bradyrhizobium sp. i1.8.4]|uniref:hypothetical protein n=1 Tax=unclassified Bradyrhizobium TaxID=2631580 RepID=UPI003D1D542F
MQKIRQTVFVLPSALVLAERVGLVDDLAILTNFTKSSLESSIERGCRSCHHGDRQHHRLE